MSIPTLEESDGKILGAAWMEPGNVVVFDWVRGLEKHRSEIAEVVWTTPLEIIVVEEWIRGSRTGAKLDASRAPPGDYQIQCEVILKRFRHRMAAVFTIERHAKPLAAK